jgi:predicted nucleotidyltransferase
MEDRRQRRSVKQSVVLEVFRALNEKHAEYLVIGGVACILHGYLRTTRDIDILIARSEDNADRVLSALATVGYGFAKEWSAKEVLARPITVIGDDPSVDVFTVAWTVKYADAVKRSAILQIDKDAVPLMGLEDLIATKRTGRLRDAADIEALEQIQAYRITPG